MSKATQLESNDVVQYLIGKKELVMANAKAYCDSIDRVIEVLGSLPLEMQPKLIGKSPVDLDRQKKQQVKPNISRGRPAGKRPSASIPKRSLSFESLNKQTQQVLRAIAAGTGLITLEYLRKACSLNHKCAQNYGMRYEGKGYLKRAGIGSYIKTDKFPKLPPPDTESEPEYEDQRKALQALQDEIRQKTDRDLTERNKNHQKEED